MTTEFTSALASRVIIDIDSGVPGPTVLIVAGIHGNEPSGVLTLEHIQRAFENGDLSLACGKILALRGNRRALLEGSRFITYDLNRMWHRDFKDLADNKPGSEHDEYHELQYRIHEAMLDRKGPICFLDLHTTSAVSPPFVMIGDTLRNRNLVDGIPVPIVLGVEEQLNSPLLSYINELGHLSIGFEAGQHKAPETIEAHEAFTQVILYRLGMIDKRHIQRINLGLDRLSELGGHLANFYEVLYRHGISSDDEFVMKPGYANFQRVEKGQILARDKNGPIRMPGKGRIFMPLYQKQGSDGFFHIQRIRRFWLKVSVFLRHIGIYKLLPVLPGVKGVKDKKRILLVNTGIARFYPRQIFHLLGFREIREEGTTIWMEKRPFDFKEPPLPPE